jgi:hypothetical protein
VAVLSVDLAFRRWSDLGIVVLDRAATVGALGESNPPISCEIIPSKLPEDEPGPVDANILAGRLNHLCGVRGIRVILLDGPRPGSRATTGWSTPG